MAYKHPMDLHLKKGALHESLHVASGQKIGEDKLIKALSSSSPLMRKRAQFAENARHWDHAGPHGA